MSKIICWWSGGITSAVACKLAIDLYGKENCRAIMIDTKNEHDDTYRFKSDCEEWYGIPIETITAIRPGGYTSIEDCWIRHKSLNVASGAVCSYKLKRVVREKWQKENEYDAQVFGFEFDTKEFKRALALRLNHPKSKPIFPLLMLGLDKKDCIKMVQDAEIKIPEAYSLGFQNNNCLKTGCIQGGVSYWKHYREVFPDEFEEMANMEHKLTSYKGQPVTILKDQSKMAKESGNWQVFLKKNEDYPHLKCLDDMKGRPKEPLTECNGFCGTNDLVNL